ncbi:MAG: hypothetical protein UW55_C0010G0032 [Candidatus Giovannonibacteria bacterium GW2011_GWA2_44_26]|uniref:Uncharacterized protein n=1 Tax=Candidatus Giovannonibacteria bacterium GW2011_GWA2_44_26 TaxID=1618648 RepID=A0A0G1IUP2_9BACT|nr:MAG: hypothetical protein UW55_C0010G0032 [Candidatus Giovannonibacteria bacterium GW2011_GWA2_44_26]
MLEKKCIASCFSRELRRAKVRANGRVGQAHIDSVLPSKKSSLQKIFGSNLTLHAREARGVPQNQWFSLLAAKENHGETNLVSRLVTLYNHARTHFTNP